MLQSGLTPPAPIVTRKKIIHFFSKTRPLFFIIIFLTKMTQNGLKWILNTTLKIVTFCRRDPPPYCNICYNFFFFLMKASLTRT